MKKIFFFLSAIALLGLTAACVEQQPVNPNYDAATNSVKTAFTFNIAATSPQTKSTAATAQYVASGVPTFRGMTNMTLFALQGNVEFNNAKAQRYDLGTLGSGVIGNSTDKPSHKIYPLSIPVGTDNMVFYAKATKNGADAEQGVTTFPTTWSTKDAVAFTLSPRLSGAATTFTTPAAAIADALNEILKAQFTPAVPDGQTASAITWKQLVTASDMNQKYATFKAVYDAIVPIRDGEVRSGSAPAVLRTASDIYKAMNVLSVNSTDGDVDALAAAIIAKIKIYFKTNDSDVTGWQSTDINANFPTNLNLPAGAAQLSYSATANDPFAPVTDPVLEPGVTGSAVAVASFMYPAELCYWSASKINVTDVDKTDADYPMTTTAWDGTWATDWTIEGTVKASTKAVAMKNNIHYGTALLATTVKYDTQIPLANEKLALKDSNDEVVAVADDGLQLTGILIGKQSSSMGWNFISKDKSFDKIVYDNAIVDGDLKISGDPTEANYTLLFDNYEEPAQASGDDATQGETTTASSNIVLVALEFKNSTGKDFMGFNNLIPKDGTFYLVGKLDLSGKSLKEAWPTGDYALPGNNTPRVFIQDYMTTANFTIKENSLKKAYYTVPDLRSTQMTFGLSVDLKWRSGYTFDVDFE